MENRLQADEQTALKLLQLAGCEGHVVCHEPSKLLPGENLSLITQEEVEFHLESPQNTILLFPAKSLVMSCCRNLSSEKKTVTVDFLILMLYDILSQPS